jgi:hypothetical protein
MSWGYTTDVGGYNGGYGYTDRVTGGWVDANGNSRF